MEAEATDGAHAGATRTDRSYVEGSIKDALDVLHFASKHATGASPLQNETADAAILLKQKMARQNRKLRRLAEDKSSQTMAPRMV